MKKWYNCIVENGCDNMITINKNIQSEILMTTMEEIVPKNSLFRKVDNYLHQEFLILRRILCEIQLNQKSILMSIF